MKNKRKPTIAGQSENSLRRLPVDMLDPPSLPTSPAFDETLSDKQFATTLARGLEILRCFSPQDIKLGNKELALRTGLPKPTVSRFTYTLSQLGYLRAKPFERKYRLGSAVLSLSYPLLAAIPLRQLARPLMNALADAVGGSVSMGIRDRLNIVYVETSRSRAPMAPQLSDMGLSHPIVGTSIGRAYLAACSRHERSAILNEVKVKTPEHYARYYDSVQKALDDYQRLGFCACYDYILPEIYGTAVTLQRKVDDEIIVFNCVVSALSTRRVHVEKEIGPRLVAMVETLEAASRAAERSSE